MKHYVPVGSPTVTVLPWSEACMHLEVAGQRRQIIVLADGVQICNDDGSNFSFPVTHGEAGVYRDERGFYVHRPDPEPSDEAREAQAAYDDEWGPSIEWPLP